MQRKVYVPVFVICRLIRRTFP